MQNMQGRIVLVTGGAGFIGLHLCERLIKEGAVVHVLDLADDVSGLPGISNRVFYHKTDICDANAVKNVIDAVRPDKVFHLAAYINPDRSPSVIKRSMDVNFYGSMNLLEALRGTRVDSIVCTSTSDVYGSNRPPFREDQMVDPISPYSLSKVASEALFRNYLKIFGLPIVVVRPVLTYGPRQKTSFLIPQAIVCALQGHDFKSTKGEQERSINYVDDTVDGFIRASCTPEAIGEVINLGTETKHTVASIVRKIFQFCGSKTAPGIGELPYRQNEIWDASCDSSKARRILGWEPRVSLDEGLQLTIDWYRKNLR